MTDPEAPFPEHEAGYPPRDERVALKRKISLKFKEFRGFVTEFSDNLSLGGMFIRTTTPAPIGTVFDFEFSLEEGEPLIHGIGQVIWVRERDQGFDHPAGIGVRFLFVDPEGRQLIERLVADRLSGGVPITEIELGPPSPRPVPLRPSAPPPEALPQPRLGPLDDAPAPVLTTPEWALETPPLDPPTGPLGAVLPGPRPGRGRGGAASPEPGRRRGMLRLVVGLVALAALGVLGWYGASLVGLVGETEAEKVPLRVSPIPAPEPAGNETPPVSPSLDPAPAPGPEAAPASEPDPPPSAAQIQPVEPPTPGSAETIAEERAAITAPEPERPGRRERHFRRIESITWQERPDGIDVILTADGKIEEWDYTLLHLANPPRELIKIENVERGFSQTTLEVGSRDLPRIRVGFHDTPAGNELHVVLDLATPSVRVEHTNASGREIRLKLVGPR